MSASIRFKSTVTDPGFLVAKGKFKTQSETELQSLLKSGVKTNDAEAQDRLSSLKKSIDSERSILEKRHVKDLANAIFMSVTNHGYASIRCIGRSATYNACKAMAIARSYCLEKGVDLRFGPSFSEGNLGDLQDSSHVENVTAMVFDLEGYEIKDKE